MLDVHALPGEFGGDFRANPVNLPRAAILCAAVLLDYAVGECLPYLAPVAPGAVILGHLEQKPMRFLLTSERVRLEGPNFSGEMTWPFVHSVYETKNAFLIYQTAQVAWILPKRFF